MKDTIVKNPPWWRRRTRLEKLLLVLSTLIFIIGLALLISLILVEKSSSSEQICVSNGCIKTASLFLDRMNISADPCDDFYEFACGNFMKNTAIPKDKASVSSFSIINDKVVVQLRDVLEDSPSETEPRSFLLAKKFYNTCLNESIIEEQGLTPLLNVLDLLDGWPVLEGNRWNEDKFDWKVLLFKMKNIGIDPSQIIIGLDIDEDAKNNTRYLMQISQVIADSDREILLKNFTDKVLKAYYDYMVNTAVSFGASKSYAEREMLAALEVQQKLANISLASEELRNASQLYNPMTIEEMQETYPNIPWLYFINTLLYPTVQLSKEDIVVVQTPSYLEKVQEVLRDTPKRALANYMIWDVLKDFHMVFPESLHKYKLKYQTAAYGITEDQPRWQQCVQRTYRRFNLAVSALFIRKFFEPDFKKKALDMVKDIQESFKDVLKQLDWMDEVTRKKAIAKAEAMDVHIAYPDELLDNKKLDEFYEKLNINESFLESELLWKQFSWDLNWSFLKKPVNNSMWITHGSAATVNAFYAFAENSISFPAGILQDVFFASDRPNYINYGAIGSIIGHEITHGFDDQGRQYDQNGLVVNWWTPETEKSFLTKAQCIITQYDNFIVPEIGEHLKGFNTQGENIADNGGLKQSYQAYRRYQNRHGEEPHLPGLPYTSRQMFWLSAAETWCSIDRPDYLKMEIYDVHSPTRFRVIGPMSNSKEFSEDWGCPVGSFMNPEHKCHVW